MTKSATSSTRGRRWRAPSAASRTCSAPAPPSPASGRRPNVLGGDAIGWPAPVATGGLVTVMAYQGAIFDVDGVLVDSPHELAWREAFRGLMEGEWREVRGQTSYSPERFTTAVYQQVMAGKPPRAGARAAPEEFRGPDIDAR